MKKPSYISVVIFVLTASALIFYSIIRADSISITGDESASFWDIHFMNIGYFFGSIANTHLLNTLSMKIFMDTFGPSELSLRAGNIIAHFFYILFTYLICKRFNGKVLPIAGFLILNSNPFIIEFFSLARGYGISMAFMMASIYFLIKRTENIGTNRRYIFFSFTSAMLSVLANYTMLNFYLGLIASCLLLYIRNTPAPFSFSLIKKSGWTIAMNFIFFCLLLPILLRLKMSGMLFVGGNKNFCQDTINSLIDASLYNQDYRTLKTLLYFTIPILLLIAIFLILQSLRKHKYSDYPIIITIIVCVSVISTITQFYLLNTPYLTQRTAVFYLPLFLLILLLLFEYFLISLPKVKHVINAIAVLVVLICFAHLTKTINIKQTYTYPSGANVKDMLSMLTNMHLKGEEKKINLGASHSLVSPINYYRLTQNLDWLNPVGYNLIFDKGKDAFYYEPVETGNYNYLYYTDEDSIIIPKENTYLITYYPLTKTYFSKYKN